MDSRLRDKHVAQVVEALIRYANSHEDPVPFTSERVGDEFDITFTLSDPEAYQAVLSTVILEDEESQQNGSEEH